MASIPTYLNFNQKSTLFKNGSENSFIVNTEEEFNNLIKGLNEICKEKSPLDVIFRGVKSAKYKLFNSAQRYWIQNDLSVKKDVTYYSFLLNLLEIAKSIPVVNHVFNRYGYLENKRDFPILALLQNYGAPTPCLDWSYTIQSALYFASSAQECNCTDSIDDYISVYRIDKYKHRGEFLNSKDCNNGVELKEFLEWNDCKPKSNSCYYLSDYEPDGFSLDEFSYNKPYPTRQPQIQKGLIQTSIFNQNIVPQDGLLVFNPHEDKCLEEMFNISVSEKGANLDLSKFYCYNIHKRLIPYIKSTILEPKSINYKFMFPNMYDIVNEIKKCWNCLT